MFEKDDYRNVRFTNSRRIVNKNWGINLIAEIPPKECTERVVSCDGGDGPLGHPKVYINLVKYSRISILTLTLLIAKFHNYRTNPVTILADTVACVL